MNINNNDITFSKNLFQHENNCEPKNQLNDNQEKCESSNEERILNKLSLRKKKLEEVLSLKRNNDIIKTFQSINKDNGNNNIENIESTMHEIIVYTKNDFISGDIFIKLKKAYDLNDINNISEIILNIANFAQKKKLDNIEIKELLMKSGYNLNNNNINQKEKYPLAFLILNIGLNTNDNLIYIYCFNFILNFSFISEDFCREINNEKNINLILERLIHFYPLFDEKNKINAIENIEINDNLNEHNSKDKDDVESFFVGEQVLKILGNIFIDCNDVELFEKNNFYNKIFYLIEIFNSEEKDSKYQNIYHKFFETLLWLISLFLEKEENFIINYKDKLLIIIPCLLKQIKMLYYTQSTEFLEKILDLLFCLNSKHTDFSAQIIDSEGIKILTNLFAYLFNYNANEHCEIILNAKIIDKILEIFLDIFYLDSKYFKYDDDFLSFPVVIERLISIYKLHAKNHYQTQYNLIIIMANLACFNDIEIIVRKFMLNANIIKDLFKYYYPYHKKDILLFIDNVMEKQDKKVRDFILDSGGFDIIKDNICNYEENNIDVVKKSIIAFYKLIQKEKAFNIRLLFEKIYNTAIPEKIKEISFDKNISQIDNFIQSIMIDFDIYEKSLEKDYPMNY